MLYFLYLLCCRFPVFTARKQLTAIDWNYHKDLPAYSSWRGDGKPKIQPKDKVMGLKDY